MITSGIATLYSLIACIAVYGIEGVGRKHYLQPVMETGDWIFLLSFIVFVYLLMLFIKIKMDKEFEKTYKVTCRLFMGPSRVIMIISTIFIIITIGKLISINNWHSEAGIVFVYAILFAFWGLTITSILSLLGFAIDSVLNKIKRNGIQG